MGRKGEGTSNMIQVQCIKIYHIPIVRWSCFVGFDKAKRGREVEEEVWVKD